MGPISMVFVAATTLLAAAPAPSFTPSYAEAIALAQQQHKPVAVFLGQGTDGFAKLVTDGLTPTAATSLKSDFICLYVDTTTEAGQKLAGNFEMTEGLVISDRDGAKQALRHAGAVPAATLATYATTFAAPNLSCAQTVYAGTAAAPAAAAPVSYSPAPVYQPAPAAFYQPAQRFAFPSMGGCASGRCPNAR